MDSDELPVHHVTIDQIVARNIRYFRKAAAMTQEDLGDAVGWTAANISAAERSAEDGRDRRRFDAHTITIFAHALGVPLLALFLPPYEEGTEARYIYSAGDEDPCEPLGMSDLMQVVYPDNDHDGPAVERYRTRLTYAVERLMDPKWARFMTRWLGKREPRDRLIAQGKRFKTAVYAVSEALSELREISGAYDAELEEDEP